MSFHNLNWLHLHRSLTGRNWRLTFAIGFCRTIFLRRWIIPHTSGLVNASKWANQLSWVTNECCTYMGQASLQALFHIGPASLTPVFQTVKCSKCCLATKAVSWRPRLVKDSLCILFPNQQHHRLPNGSPLWSFGALGAKITTNGGSTAISVWDGWIGSNLER